MQHGFIRTRDCPSPMGTYSGSYPKDLGQTRSRPSAPHQSSCHGMPISLPSQPILSDRRCVISPARSPSHRPPDRRIWQGDWQDCPTARTLRSAVRIADRSIHPGAYSASTVACGGVSPIHKGGSDPNSRGPWASDGGRYSSRVRY